MKNIILLTFVTFFCTCLKAQNWNPAGDNTTIGNVMGKNLLVYKGITSVLDIDNYRQAGLYRIQDNGYSNALLDISGISGSTPRFQILANYSDRLYFRAARDTENNWDSKGFREILTADDYGTIDFGDRKFTAKNILINRGAVNLIDINNARETGLYKVSCQGYTDALIDISGFSGSTPRIQLRANYADKLYFRASRDSESNWDNKEFREVVMANENGNVGIGTTTPDYKLDVVGTIRARELKVDMQGADFVFEKDYQLRTIEEVEEFVSVNKHLPEIAPAKEMQENGVNQSEMNQKLLQKIEELTLYVIDLNKKVTDLQEENQELKKETKK